MEFLKKNKKLILAVIAAASMLATAPISIPAALAAGAVVVQAVEP